MVTLLVVTSIFSSTSGARGELFLLVVFRLFFFCSVFFCFSFFMHFKDDTFIAFWALSVLEALSARMTFVCTYSLCYYDLVRP